MKSNNFDLLLFHHAPKIWERYWSSRLTATVFCGERWLKASNPEFTRWQISKRNLLALLVFFTPGLGKIKIRVTKAD